MNQKLEKQKYNRWITWWSMGPQQQWSIIVHGDEEEEENKNQARVKFLSHGQRATISMLVKNKKRQNRKGLRELLQAKNFLGAFLV